MFSTIKNSILSLGVDLFYVVESANWAILDNGKYITQNLNKNKLLRSRTTVITNGITNRLIHFGSEHTTNHNIVNSNNINVISIYHLDPKFVHTNYYINLSTKMDKIHTSSTITKNELINLGVESIKIKVIPMGVDRSIFTSISQRDKKRLRKKINMDPEAWVIGSFQKDGIGWGNGMKPKIIKGPDILVNVLSEINKVKPIQVILTGPARGYVKRQLDIRKIKYFHFYLDTNDQVAEYMQICDLCLVTSRVEGGPKQVLEAMACGVPVITTEVGMIPQLVVSKKNGIVCKVDDVSDLIKSCLMVMNSNILKKSLSEAAISTSQEYSWEKIARKYFEEIYHPLLRKKEKSK